ncbi:hypothetical protein BMS_0780 [Halobacteriovorax marinus SJ]|uniref:Uncharacterized protein n=1 Tax=Halobacteriovorax marinus (strain ATCC BAA-682 / DSM 15412 / SJ) TaxID=862908 RepID=E1X5W5_HALMS|nr:hypothetical protein [Halobacteriovorax marinus]CBW25682.1 hypothetical protein BMS_0780 [Halobacteriovorax marinus SJ]
MTSLKVKREIVERRINRIKEYVFESNELEQVYIDDQKMISRLCDDTNSLKIALYDYFARISWIEIDNQLNKSEQLFRRSIFGDIHIMVEDINLGEESSLKVYKTLFDEELEEGIIHFLPLLGKNNRNLKAGVATENHGFGYHYHYCKGKNIARHDRTTLQFTNDVKDIGKNDFTMYSGQHGSGIKVVADEVNGKIRTSLISKNKDLVKKYKKNWLKVSKDFEEFKLFS